MNDVFFAETDSAKIEAEVLSTYEAVAKTTLYPGDPVRLFMEGLAYEIAVQRNVINLAGRQTLLAYATGDHLDHIGMMVGTDRLPASHARCSQSFRLREPLAFNVPVPLGTRVTTGDGKSIFATEQAGMIAAGEIETVLPVASLAPGKASNGLVAGQICQLVDPVPYIAATANMDATLSGSDVETDEHYRERIQLAPEAFSCAGPAGEYRYRALSAHPDIADVAVYSPEPGVVDIRPVMKGGELPGQDVIDAVYALCNGETVRPLTDMLTVGAPDLVYYRIDFTWYMEKGDETLYSAIAARVADAVESYRLWQRTKPGRDILPLKLLSLLEQAGARRVVLKSPFFTPLDHFQLAREAGIGMEFGGFEE